MCTALSFKTKDHYFGRNLDIEFSYNEEIVIAPRNFVFNFKHLPPLAEHFAMIGVAAISLNYPLYFDATNEKGLSIAGLNFPGNAEYGIYKEGFLNLTPYELIPYVLGNFETVEKALPYLEKLNLINVPFSPAYPLTPLHFIISDKEKSIVIEPRQNEIKLYDNPVNVLANNPPFPFHIENLNNYMALSNGVPENNFSKSLALKPYSRGMGAMGLPGDLSSASRFIRAAFISQNVIKDKSEQVSVNQFFHVLKSVEQQKGSVVLENGETEYTIYTTCCNTDKGIFYYTTYENSQISCIRLYNENLDSEKLIAYPMIHEQQIYKHN